MTGAAPAGPRGAGARGGRPRGDGAGPEERRGPAGDRGGATPAGGRHQARGGGAPAATTATAAVRESRAGAARPPGPAARRRDPHHLARPLAGRERETAGATGGPRDALAGSRTGAAARSRRAPALARGLAH